jgi:hypothetical protein
MEKVEKWMLARDEERWLEEYSMVRIFNWIDLPKIELNNDCLYGMLHNSSVLSGWETILSQ